MKVREILERIDMRLVSINCIDAVQKQSIDKCRMLIKQALSAPPRQCDMGTADEQLSRFVAAWESAHRSVVDRRSMMMLSVFSRWAQMPYAEKEGGAK